MYVCVYTLLLELYHSQKTKCSPITLGAHKPKGCVGRKKNKEGVDNYSSHSQASTSQNHLKGSLGFSTFDQP